LIKTTNQTLLINPNLLFILVTLHLIHVLICQTIILLFVQIYQMSHTNFETNHDITSLTVQHALRKQRLHHSQLAQQMWVIAFRCNVNIYWQDLISRHFGDIFILKFFHFLEMFFHIFIYILLHFDQ